jgi:hypothetical protein
MKIMTCSSDKYTTGWQDSEVSTKYVYTRLHDILDTDNDDDMVQKLSVFSSEIAHTYFADTGDKIGNPKVSAGLQSIL